MAIELTTADSETISSIRASLSAANSEYYTLDEYNSVIITSIPSGGDSADIRLNSADDIFLQGSDETTLGRNGGNIRIDGGDGGTAGDGDTGGNGGDINLYAGRGGDASQGGGYTGGYGGDIRLEAGNGGNYIATLIDDQPAYNVGGGGGFVYVAGGNGADANTGVEYLGALDGGRIEIVAGNAGGNDGNPSAGAVGGPVIITAGNSTNDGPGANVVITSGIGAGGGEMSVSGEVQLRVPIQNSGNYREWIFSEDGFITFPGGAKLRLKGYAPSSSVGEEGDRAGMFAFDNDYFYYCVSDYVDIETNIWKRVQLDGSTWGV